MPLMVRMLFGAMFLTVAATLHVYLYRRLIRDVTDRRVVRLTAVGALGGGAVTSIAGFVLYRTTAPSLLTAALPMWFALVLYVAMALLLIDLVRWLARRKASAAATQVSPERRMFLSRAVATTGVLAGTGLASYGVFRAYSPAQVTEVPLVIPKLPRALDGFTLAHLSDIHIGPVLQRKFLDDLVDRTNAVKPDLVAITGDLVDGRPEHLGPAVEALTRLKSRYGTYFVTGNHDYYSGADAWVRVLQGWGIGVLRNRRVLVGDAGASFDLLGVDDWGTRGMAHDYDLDAATAGRSPDRASVLMAHQPSGFDEVAARGLDVQLSGHTHGGQTFPATGIAWLMWGPRSAGLSRVGDSYLFVSRGCGFVGPPTRIGSPPEIGKLVLTTRG
jgi:uncharacterized protein